MNIVEGVETHDLDPAVYGEAAIALLFYRTANHQNLHEYLNITPEQSREVICFLKDLELVNYTEASDGNIFYFELTAQGKQVGMNPKRIHETTSHSNNTSITVEGNNLGQIAGTGNTQIQTINISEIKENLITSIKGSNLTTEKKNSLLGKIGLAFQGISGMVSCYELTNIMLSLLI